MSTGSVNNYIQAVDGAYKRFQGEELSRLLSVTDAHVADESLRSSDAASLVEGNCEAPLDELIVGHLLCVKALCYKQYLAAYHHQRQCVAAVVEVLRSQVERNWCLPLMYTVCSDLRLLAHKAEPYAAQSKILEKAAESLCSCFVACLADKHALGLGMLYLANQLLRVYSIRIKKLYMCDPVIRAIDSSQLWHQFPLAQQVTYRYFVGRKALLDFDFDTAEENLSFAFQKCHPKSHKNKRLILTYLIPAKMLCGYLPTEDILEKYDLLQFRDLISKFKTGDLRAIDRVMEEHKSFFSSTGIYLSFQYSKLLAYRSLFKKVYLVENNHQIDIASFQAALQMMGQEDVDSDETLCIVTNLICYGLIDGYISYQHKKLVLSKQNAFPPLSSL